ncbi:hypothetical protein [Sulfurimonas sp.]
MKLTNIALSLALMGTLSLGMADDTATTDTTTSVDAQITAIQEAPAQERVKLMNQFKQKLMNMNEADRTAAIAKLQTKVQTKTQTRVQDATATAEDAVKTKTQTRTQARTRAQEMAQDMQLESAQEMNRVQNMNQNQMQNQIMDSMPTPTDVTGTLPIR